ncbi:MAG: LPS export ABC transporter periplasmic protein LptC [Muribaculaceae bacterium]|nr:LPS export ABC transporter periplasmic protein LptC [Muribaculaceae bacterium]
MRQKELAMRLFPFALTALGLGAGIVTQSCGEEKRETIAISADPETFPTMKTLDVSTTISDSGFTRYHITSPIWLMFEEAQEPHWNFPEGLYVIKYDNNMKEDGTFTADTATYWSVKKLWRFDRNVRMKNVNGDRFLTQQLFWDQNKRKLYSDSFIHIERSDRIIEGYGFESNEEMTEYVIRRPSGIFPTSDFVSDR